MKRRSPRLCTGRTRLRRVFAALAASALLAVLLGALAGQASAQTLRLRALSIPQDIQPGRWVSFQVRLQTQNRPAREFTQRLAVVAQEGWGDEAGLWVELKTVETGKTRIERGFFGRPPAEDEPAVPTPESAEEPEPPLRLMRYQMLTPQGKLYELPSLTAEPRLLLPLP